MDGRERFLFVFLKVAPCSCRCRHCDFAVSGTYPTVPLDQAAGYLEPFVRARDAGTIPFGNMAALLGDAPLNYAHLAEGVAYLRRHQVEGWYSLAANGFRPRPADEWRRYLEAIREAGTEYLELTLYGARQTHDWFSGRGGDFDAIAGLAHLWRDEMQGKTLWSVFVHKSNLAELSGLVARILDEHGEKPRLHLWGYLGFAATQPLEDLRIDVEDLDSLDAELRAQLESAKSERDWVAELVGSQDSPHPAMPPVVHLVVDNQGTISLPYRSRVRLGHAGAMRLGQFPLESAESLLTEHERWYQTWRSSYPTLGALCAAHGDLSGTKLYDLPSIREKWCDAHDSTL